MESVEFRAFVYCYHDNNKLPEKMNIYATATMIRENWFKLVNFDTKVRKRRLRVNRPALDQRVRPPHTSTGKA